MTPILRLCLCLLLGPASCFAAKPLADVPTEIDGKPVFNVQAFGAKGDGETKDTAAFQKALDQCGKVGGGTVFVPAGFYLIGSVTMSSNTTIQLQGRANLLGSPDLDDYPLARVRWEGEFSPGHRALISAEKADHIAIAGGGSIFGPPLTLSHLRNPRGPCLIEVSECNDVRLEGFTAQYQQLWAIHLSLSEKIVARKLTIRSVNFNGDGIDADSCRNLLIEHCNIDTGDDAIALKSGRGMEAVRLARPIEDVTIRDCTLQSSIYAGLAIGTEISGGARRIRVENCIISGRQNAIFIKSRDGRGASMEEITGENLTIQNSPTLIGIDLKTKGIQATEPVTGSIEKWTLLKNVTFRNIKVHNVAELIAGKNIPAERPAEGLTFTRISGDCEKGITLANVLNAKFAELNLTGFQGPLFTLTNVTGTGFENQDDKIRP